MATDAPASALPERRPRRPSLFGRIFSINAVVLAIAGVLLALSPATVSQPVALSEAVVLVGGLTAILLLNLFFVRRAVVPLVDLTALMNRVDSLQPGQRVPVSGNEREVVELAESFNIMLDRLEAERRESGQRAITVQEEERLRVARELHDQVGQTLTGVLLQHESLIREAPAGLRERIAETRETVRASLDDVRRIAGDLRPGTLEDLGLVRAVADLSDRSVESSQLEVVRELDPAIPALAEEVELVVYRVAQEGLTNVLRHAEASCIEVHLEALGDFGVRLRLLDDGQGLEGAYEGDGIRGMRERAMLVGGDLSVADRSHRGVELRLDVPATPTGDRGERA